MKPVRQQRKGKTAYDLIEEATHLLRTAPTASLAIYYAGAVPFVLGTLFFWADMSRSPLAPQHIGIASLGLAGLFVWMKLWQVIFARRIRAQAAHQPVPFFTVRDCIRIAITQSIIQPLGLFLLPLAIFPVLPFAWAFAFFQSATALDDGIQPGTGALIKAAAKQARLWSSQNFLLLAVMSGFGLLVFLNWITVCYTLPELFKMLFGIDSIFIQSPLALLNTTFFAGMFGLTYLCVDPIIKTIYVLRCFYGESLQSGEDLKAELKPFVRLAAKTSAVALVIFIAAMSVSAVAGTTNAPSANAVIPSVTPPDLDRAINQTIHEQKYVWRMPREAVVQPETEDGWLLAHWKALGKKIAQWASAIKDWLEDIWDKLFHRRTTSHVQMPSGYGWIMSLEILLYGLLAAVIIALLVLLYRVWRRRKAPTPAVASEPIQPLPDVADENVGADQLPEDGWTKMAREFLERGEFRLAMRAFYLAGLAHLAERNLISIARFKSNRDYERELQRRAHALPGLLPVFGDNIRIFERIWYGMHDANREIVDQFAANVERLRGSA